MTWFGNWLGNWHGPGGASATDGGYTRLTAVIGRFATPGPYTITRYPPGTYTLGKLVRGVPQTFTITACIQPVTGRELLTLAEGQRADDVKIVYCVRELRTRTPLNEPDAMTYKGETWIVTKCEAWEAFGGKHYRATIERNVIP